MYIHNLLIDYYMPLKVSRALTIGKCSKKYIEQLWIHDQQHCMRPQQTR